MNKRPYKEIEEQMKASAESWEPAFDEQSWEHMEKMLDGEKDRRRPIAWWVWLLPVILGITIGGYFLLSKNKTPGLSAEIKKISNEIEPPINEHLQKPAAVSQIPGSASLPEPKNGKNQIIPAASNQRPLLTIPNDQLNRTVSFKTDRNRSKTTLQFTSSPSSATDDIEPAKKQGIKKPVKFLEDEKANMKISPATSGVVDDPLAKKENTSTAASEPLMADSSKSETTQIAIIETDSSKITITKAADNKVVKDEKNIVGKEEKSIRKYSSFYFGLSGGVDGSGVDFPGLNKFAPRVGLSVGYHLDRKLSVATGFFAGNKKYVAGKGDYKAKAGSYWSTVDIREVDANCRVFEIPVWLRYDFSTKKKWNPFVAVGISSFIMDKEDYEYYYYRFGNPNPYYASHTYKGNQHLFSVLRFSGGIEKQLSKNFFLTAQPGLAIPLGGVGDGQVKLYSTEVLLGLKYRPFKKAK